MVFSASSATSVLGEGGGDGAEYLKRTLIFAAIGLLAMRVASVRGVAVARAMTPILVAAGLILLVAVMLPGIGQTVNGSQRWIGAGLLQFQPSELAKVALVLYGAHLLASRPKRIRSLEGLAPLLVVAGLALALIALQPDLGTAMTTTFALGCLLLASGVRPRTLLPVALVGALAVIAVIATNPYQQERLTGFLNPGGGSGRRRVPGHPGLDRARLGRGLRRRARRERAEGLLPARGPHRHDRRGDRGGGGSGRDVRADRAVRDLRLRGLPRGAPCPRPLRQAACRRADLAGPGPGVDQPVRGLGPGAADRGAAALRLLRRHEPGRDPGRDRPDPERGSASRGRIRRQPAVENGPVHGRWQTANARRRCRDEEKKSWNGHEW